jgi:predicted methyltransferase
VMAKAPVVAKVDAGLAPILADARRDKDRARDAYRHPAESLAFFRVKPGMTVVDYLPSGGWWTRILVPYLGEKGHYIGLNPDVRALDERARNSMGNVGATFPAKAAGWTGVAADRIAAYNSDAVPDAVKGTADRVLIFREMHNLWAEFSLRTELLAVRSLLKPDGLLGIEEHRAAAGSTADYTNGTMGYMREKDVIALIEAHGFELVAKSEINANPKDKANYPGGVWTLPPNYSGAKSEADRAKVAAIGESDRMTLLFRKRP